MSLNKLRLDLYLVEHGVCESRSLAQDAIQAGRVSVNGKTILKNSFSIHSNDEVNVVEAELNFASRAGFKLYGAAIDFNLDLSNRIVADIGASTGGFSDVCLTLGAKHVYAIDVGSNQLIPRLKNDSRITSMEHVNCRYLETSMFAQLPNFACMDVSFISIKLILPVLTEILTDNKEMLVLVKPQFEAGRVDVGKNGIVKNKKVHQRILNEMIQFVESLGLFIHHLDVSSIKGRDGNKEYVMHLSKQECHRVFQIKEIVEKKVGDRW